MRNLKKVMALALATVMLLGIMVMGAGAADYKAYKDAASVDGKYELAIEMMKELGVFEGDNNGNLNAKNTLTRAEAAKVIATVKLGKTTASKIGAPIAAPFADVAVSDWYAPFVAYCKDLGIISGVGDNKFDPAGTLTGYAFAKMLMVAAGYDAGKEGFTGATWDTNVNLKAYTLKLLENLSINLGDAITREQAIQMAYNTMTQVKMVSYKDSGFNITTPDGFSMSSNAGEYTHYDYTLLQYLNPNTYTYVPAGTYTTDLGLPTVAWVKGTTKVAQADAYTVIKTYTGDITTVQGKTLFADAGLTANKTAKVYANWIADNTERDSVNLSKTSTDVAAKKTGEGAYDYKGATMSLIKAGDEYIVLLQYNYFAKVKTVNAATATTKANVVLGAKGGDLTIETDAYKVGDLVSYTRNATKVLTHKAATIVTGKVTETTTKEVVINGEKYLVADFLNGNLGTEFKAPATPADYTLNSTEPYNLVVENGYIFGSTTVETPATAATLTGVVYVNTYTTISKDLFGTVTGSAQVVSLADGTATLVPVKVQLKKNSTTEYEYAENHTGALCVIENVTGETYKDLQPFNGKDNIFQGTLAETDGKLEKADKAITIVAQADTGHDTKAYLTAATAIFNITGTGTDVKGTYVAAPFDVKLAEGQTASKVIYTVTKDKDGKAVNTEAGIIIIKGKLTANTVATTADYYVLAGNAGSVWNAESKETNYKRFAIDMKTFEKVPVQTADKDFVGFAKATLTKGAYSFDATGAKPSTVVEVKSGATLYGTYLTAGGKVDVETKDAKVINFVDAKTKADATKNIATVKELVDAGVPFYMNVTDKGVVTYIIIK